MPRMIYQRVLISGHWIQSDTTGWSAQTPQSVHSDPLISPTQTPPPQSVRSVHSDPLISPTQTPPISPLRPPNQSHSDPPPPQSVRSDALISPTQMPLISLLTHTSPPPPPPPPIKPSSCNTATPIKQKYWGGDYVPVFTDSPVLMLS